MNNDLKDLGSLRNDYIKDALDISQLSVDPREQFSLWFSQALNAQALEPNAMTLSTVSSSGQPSSRTVLLKELDDVGLVFYTNYNSQKSKEIGQNNRVSLLFFWKELERQVRIQGYVDKIEESVSIEYFQSRPKGSQIGAWASAQSDKIVDRSILELEMKRLEILYQDAEVLPKPPHWGGFRCVPSYWEFWQGRANRLHDRFAYTRLEQEWNINRLAP